MAVLVAALDAPEAPVAETWRQVSAAAEHAGMRRPSYGHVRRLVLVHRRALELRREGRQVWGQLAATLAAGRVPSASWTLENVLGGSSQDELVFQEHKPFSGGGESGGATAPARRSRGPSGPRPPR